MKPDFDPQILRSLALSETGFVFDPRTGHSFSVNGTGLAVLTALREGVAPRDIPSRLQGQFESGEAALEDDVASFLRRMQELGIGARPGTAG